MAEVAVDLLNDKMPAVVALVDDVAALAVVPCMVALMDTDNMVVESC